MSGEEVSYQYDQLGRLIAASTTGPEWGLAWVYDGFGTRLQQNVTKGTGPSAVFNVDPMTNRMTGAGINYDANGNMTGFGTGSGTATYDLFNRMVNVTTGNGTEWYGYSAANQRIQVSRANGTFETFFYGLGGELLGVYQRGTKANGHYYFSSASIRVWFSGRLIDGGGNSMVTDRLGSVVRNETEALSYYPHGEQRTGNANADREKFATYSRDGVSGLDYAWNRYYSPQFGRFTSADPYRASRGPADPQSWNRYIYVEDDPVNRTDLSGLQYDVCADAVDALFASVCIERARNAGRWVTFLAGGYYDEDSGNSWAYFKQYWVPNGTPGGGGGATAKITSNKEAKDQIDDAINAVADDCFGKLGVSRSAVQEKAKNIMVFDGRPNQDGGSNVLSTLGPTIDVGSRATFYSVSYAANAVTLPYVGGGLSRYIVLGSSFFLKDASDQCTTLAHEVFHYTLNKNDLAFNPQTGYTGTNVGEASVKFTEWPRGGCK
nr:RHS repeat-associated core domain-containing protein [uncultured Paludibaculum sp.]